MYRQLLHHSMQWLLYGYFHTYKVPTVTIWHASETLYGKIYLCRLKNQALKM